MRKEKYPNTATRSFLYEWDVENVLDNYAMARKVAHAGGLKWVVEVVEMERSYFYTKCV